LRANARAVGGWAGDAPEREWALFIKGVVESKLAKLAQDGFEKADQNWLSIYDNLPLPSVHLARAIEMLMPLLKEVWAAVPKFDALFIEHGPVIARMTAEDTEYLGINNLWQP
jgi:hypothetical protein